MSSSSSPVSLETRQKLTLGIALLSLTLNFVLGFYLWRRSGPVQGRLQIVGSQGEILELGELTHLPFGGESKQHFGLQILGSDGHVRAGLAGSPKDTRLMLMNGGSEVFFSIFNGAHGTRIITTGGGNLAQLDLPVKHSVDPDARPHISVKEEGEDFIILGLIEFLSQLSEATPSPVSRSGD